MEQMIGNLLYMIPFFGMFVGTYFIYTEDMAAGYIMSVLALTQSLICLAYILKQILLAGTDGRLEMEVQLWDALMPVIFLVLSAISFLLIINKLLGTVI
tara:strand:+ start:114 stop:410 length:297 start_codon:yes stop_codon:yes gene_type:complete